MPDNPDHRVHPVVVVGAGPAGLTAAITLARQGLEVLLIERRTGAPQLPRATGISLRTMELVRSWGLQERVLAGGVDVELSMFELPSVPRAAEGRRIDVGFPTRQQAALLSPAAPACVPQDHLEAVLLEHLGSLPSATIERGLEVVAVSSGATRVTLRLRDTRTGADRSLVAAHVVAADGGRSIVRTELGIQLAGGDALIQGVRAEFHAALWEQLGEHRHTVYSVTEPGAVGTLLPVGPDDRWIFGFDTASGATPEAREELRRRIGAATGIPRSSLQLDRIDQFSSDAKLADTFTSGRIHLAGDAAHKITPRGATGLNTAIADGWDIGWRLGWVLRGWAPVSFLGTYEAERRPVARHNVDRSADPMGTRRAVAFELQVDLGGRIPHGWVDDPSPSAGGEGREGSRRSTLDLLGPGLTLFVGPDAHGRPTAPVGTPPIRVAPLEGMTARALGLGRAGAALVRPDGIPVASWADVAGSGTDPRQTASSFVGAGPRSAA